jgi:hypothetical protein
MISALESSVTEAPRPQGSCAEFLKEHKRSSYVEESIFRHHYNSQSFKTSPSCCLLSPNTLQLYAVLKSGTAIYTQVISQS